MQEFNTQDSYYNKEEHMLQLKRDYFFKNNANKTALVVILSMLLQNLIAIPFLCAYYFMYQFTGIGYIVDYEIYTWFMYIIATVGSSLIIYKMLSKSTGVRKEDIFVTKNKMPASWIAILTMLVLGINGMAVYLSNFFDYVFGQVGIQLIDPIGDTSSIESFIVFAIMVVIVAPIFEELLFRGIMLNALKRYGNFFAVVVSSIFFGLMHGNLYQIPFTMAVGFICGYATIKTGSIKSAIVIHMINNGLSVIQMFLYMINVPYVNEATMVIYTIFAVFTVIFLILNKSKINWISPYNVDRNGKNYAIPIDKKYKKFFLTPCSIISIIFCIGLCATSFAFI